MLGNIIILYLAGFAAIMVLTRLSLRSEPTAHGQIVGRQMGFIVGLFWPIAIPWIIVSLAVFGVRDLWRHYHAR